MAKNYETNRNESNCAGKNFGESDSRNCGKNSSKNKSKNSYGNSYGNKTSDEYESEKNSESDRYWSAGGNFGQIKNKVKMYRL